MCGRPRQCRHDAGGSICWCRSIWCRRSRLAVTQDAQEAKRSNPSSQRTPGLGQRRDRARGRSCARSHRGLVRETGRPRPALPSLRSPAGSVRALSRKRRSRMPRPPSAEASRPVRRRPRTAGRSARNTRSATPRRDSARDACSNWVNVKRLFRRSSAAGCAVSSPIATSSAAGRPGVTPWRDSASSRRSTRGPISAGCTPRRPGRSRRASRQSCRSPLPERRADRRNCRRYRA